MEMITQRIRNELEIEVEENVDFTTSTDIEFYVVQGSLFFQYTPEVITAKKIVVTIPKEDAMQLSNRKQVEMQFALTNATGNYVKSEISYIGVDRFLKEAGYGV